MIKETTTARREAGGFVCDRCTLDLAAFWLYYGFGFDAPRTARYVARARRAMDVFSMVVLAPTGIIALREDGIRSANPWIQMHYEAVLQAFLKASPVPVMTLPADAVGVEQRVRQVRAWVAPAVGAADTRPGS